MHFGGFPTQKGGSQTEWFSSPRRHSQRIKGKTQFFLAQRPPRKGNSLHSSITNDQLNCVTDGFLACCMPFISRCPLRHYFEKISVFLPPFSFSFCVLSRALRLRRRRRVTAKKVLIGICRGNLYYFFFCRYPLIDLPFQERERERGLY